jgi:nitrogenase molybdenum-iron protein alpha/beta subunit
MPLHIEELESVLENQKNIYIEILDCEEKKSKAVISRNGKLIEEISARQEKLIKSVENLEFTRLEIIKKYFAGKKVNINPEAVTLKEIAETAEREAGEQIVKLGSDLKALLLKVKAKQENNASMLKDNMEYFDILISGLKNRSSMKSGYDRDGKEDERVINPVLFNQRA